MPNSKRDFFTDPDRLAEGFLLSEYIWDANPESKELSKELMMQALCVSASCCPRF